MNIKISTLPYQEDFIRSECNTMFVAGYGTGKSYAGTMKTIIRKLRYPQHKVAYYLPSFPLVRDVAFDKFCTILEDLKLQNKNLERL